MMPYSDVFEFCFWVWGLLPIILCFKETVGICNTVQLFVQSFDRFLFSFFLFFNKRRTFHRLWTEPPDWSTPTWTPLRWVGSAHSEPSDWWMYLWMYLAPITAWSRNVTTRGMNTTGAFWETQTLTSSRSHCGWRSRSGPGVNWVWTSSGRDTAESTKCGTFNPSSTGSCRVQKMTGMISQFFILPIG